MDSLADKEIRRDFQVRVSAKAKAKATETTRRPDAALSYLVVLHNLAVSIGKGNGRLRTRAELRMRDVTYDCLSR
jgi:hypothetical protein